MRLAYVDLETTGGSATRDRITEIGLVLVDDGEVVLEWSTLVNPGVRIPSYIVSLTGISDEMVADAPSFVEVAHQLIDRLIGRVVIAHNARFDVGFLRNELNRTRETFDYPVVCTVKLSRKLYPQHRKHNLDALIERHQLDCNARHRALGDALVLPKLVQQMTHDFGWDVVQKAMAVQQKLSSLPPKLDPKIIEGIPNEPGVYFMYGEEGVLLYIGKSVTLRTRIVSHFSGDHSSDREMTLSQQVVDIEWQVTAGEFSALLLEAELIKQRKPLLNRRLRASAKLMTLVWDKTQDQAPKLTSLETLDARNLDTAYGLFKTKRQAQDLLHFIADDQQLCHQKIGLDKGSGACFRYQIKQCKGVCADNETELQHRLRLQLALNSHKIKAWPYKGPIAVHERNEASGIEQWQVIDHWCYLGSVAHEAELESVLPQEELNLDADFYKLFQRFLKGKPRVIELYS